MSDDDKQKIASLMLVDLLVRGHDVTAIATKLVNEKCFGSALGFNNACREIGEMYKRS